MTNELRGLRGLLIILCAALALVVAGNSALAIALPDIAADLGADQSQLTWIIDAYALTFAALLLTAGLAADRLGRRRVLVAGLSIFGVACLASAYAPDPTWFIALRAIAGVGAAAVFPVTLSALVDAYPEDRRSFAIGVWSGVSSAGAVAGTIVAGLLLEAFWWGSVQVVFGAAALALVFPSVRLVAENANSALSLDPKGALWSVVGLAAFVFAVIEGPQRGWLSPVTVTAAGVAAAGFILFVRHQLHAKVPSLDVRLFARPGLAAGSLIVTAQFFASLGFFVLSPQYLQIVLGYSPLGTAVALLVVPVGVGIGIAVGGALSKASGQRLPGVLGLVVMAAGLALFASGLDAGPDATLWVLGVGVLVFGIGFGAGITPGTELIIDGLPADRRSVASAVNDITREVGGVVGIAVLSSVLVSAYRTQVADQLGSLAGPMREAIDAGAAVALQRLAGAGPEQAATMDAVRVAFAVGLQSAMWVAASVLVAAAVAVFALAPRGRATTGGESGVSPMGAEQVG